MLVAVLSGLLDVADERRGQLFHSCAVPRVPRDVPLRGPIGRLWQTIGNRTKMSPVCPTVYPGCPGTAWGVKTRVKDLHLRFCELYGTPGNCPEPRNGACYGRSAVVVIGRVVSLGVRGRQAAWELADSGRACADRPAPARRRWRRRRRRARPAAYVKPGRFRAPLGRFGHPHLLASDPT